MDRWFDHWHLRKGEANFLGIPYTLLIADISDALHANPERYMSNAIHLNEEGGELAAQAIVAQINQCPEGRWQYGENALTEHASYPPVPFMEYLDEEHPGSDILEEIFGTGEGD